MFIACKTASPHGEVSKVSLTQQGNPIKLYEKVNKIIMYRMLSEGSNFNLYDKLGFQNYKEWDLLTGNNQISNDLALIQHPIQLPWKKVFADLSADIKNNCHSKGKILKYELNSSFMALVMDFCLSPQEQAAKAIWSYLLGFNDEYNFNLYWKTVDKSIQSQHGEKLESLLNGLFLSRYFMTDS